MAKNVHEMNETEKALLETELLREVQKSSDNWFFVAFWYGMASAILGGTFDLWPFLAIIVPIGLALLWAKSYFVKRRVKKWLSSFTAFSPSPASEQSSDLS